MEALDKLTLYSEEAEEMVIGSIFLEPDLLRDCELQASDFTPGPNWNIWVTFLDMQKRNKPIELVTLIDRLSMANKSVEDVGGIGHITRIATGVHSLTNFRRYCEIVKEKSQTRQALNVVKKTQQAILEGGDTLDAINKGKEDLQAIADSGTTTFNGSIKPGLIRMYEMLEQATGEINGISTGFKDTDRIIGGLKPGDFVVIGARPSMGKTAYVINSAINTAKSPLVEEGDVAAIFSLETLEEGILKRAAATIGNIDLHSMKTAGRSFTAEDWKKLQGAMGVLSKMDLEIFDKPGADIPFIRANVRDMVKRYEGRRIIVFIDYLQLITGNPIHRGNRTQEVSEISRQLKLMAMELQVTIVALAQLSRGIEQRQDKRPMMSDLKESGSIEQDADIIQFLYRDDYYDKETENANMLEVIIAKQRDGATGTVSLAFIKEFGKILNIDWSQHQSGGKS